jgi:plasmid stabilization system protein ParE
MKPVEFHPEARNEFEQDIDFYNLRVPGLGDEFCAAVRDASQKIQTDPLRFPRRKFGTRRLLVRRFPYAVVYREDPSRILIVAVAHGARRPGYWHERI